MKECKECEFFEGYDYSDGTPRCSYSSEDGGCGYEYCPYNNATDIKQKGMKFEIDIDFLNDYIRHTITNTIENVATNIAKREIASIVDADIKNKITEEIKGQISVVVSEEIDSFMKKEITIGGGWYEPERTLTREAYLAETIEDTLKNSFKSDQIKKYADTVVKSAIEDYTKRLKNDINEGVKTYFDSATRQILTENVVSMLMCNDTYQRLSESMKTFLPDKTNN